MQEKDLIELQQKTGYLEKVLTGIQKDISETRDDVRQLLFSQERGKGAVWAIRALGAILISGTIFFVKDKVDGYEKWNYQQDASTVQAQKEISALSDRVSVIEYKLNKAAK